LRYTQERTLKCDANESTIETALFLTIPADARHSCDIKCKGADRDSVISKSPTTNRRCIRFYTYNTERVSDGWQMWREGPCAKESIILQVHCGFPLKDN
uniref:ADAM_CR_2 domain-containing protein n=1 Tax=Heligmosomoides polygyrus TaxID=6339 RepID=A0A183G0T0_HELPZ